MKTRKEPQEAYREVVGKIGKNLQLFQRAQRLIGQLAALGVTPEPDFSGGLDPATLAAERNQLIREWLPTLDRSSVRSCARVSRLLDEQRGRILPQFVRLKEELKWVCSDLEAVA